MIIEKLKTIDHKLLAAGRDYDSSKDWVPNAIASHTERPFRAIISTPEKQRGEILLDVETLSDSDKRWAVPRGNHIARSATELATAAQTLLRCSSEIVLVDQHFSCGPRHGRPLTEFLKFAQTGSTLRRMEYHLGSEKTGTAKWFKDELDKQRSFFNLNSEARIVFVRWKPLKGGENMHARFVLTERGGLRYDYGLDEGDEGETTDVECLDPEVYNRRWEQYHPDSGAFELVDAFIVTASGVSEAKWQEGAFVES